MADQVKPLSPAEARAECLKNIPNVVVDAVNHYLRMRAHQSEIRIKQVEIIEYCERHDYSREALFKNNWLDFEDLYRARGWKVYYDKPSYDESYDAAFVFSVQKPPLPW